MRLSGACDTSAHGQHLTVDVFFQAVLVVNEESAVFTESDTVDFGYLRGLYVCGELLRHSPNDGVRSMTIGTAVVVNLDLPFPAPFAVVEEKCVVWTKEQLHVVGV